MDMAMSYTGKCENCGIEHPSISILVKKDRGDGIGPNEFWCLKCLGIELGKHYQQQ